MRGSRDGDRKILPVSLPYTRKLFVFVGSGNPAKITGTDGEEGQEVVDGRVRGVTLSGLDTSQEPHEVRQEVNRFEGWAKAPTQR